jgi:hydrogenase nickel incorporation protein HypA/HybF
MHEIGIASAILEAAEKETAQRRGATLMVIGVRVGALSGVDQDALRFAFGALVMETRLSAVKLEILNSLRRDRCLDCGNEFESPGHCLGCPCCGSTKVVLVGGDELDLAYVEVEEV